MGVQDNFKSGSDQYAQYRPSYPRELFDYLCGLVHTLDQAWDCGTGTGQVAMQLAGKFRKVYASDISLSQIAHASQADNIIYSVQEAERTDFHAAQFDLITVGQAVHWFDFDRFYAEVRRTARSQGMLCLMGYDLIQIDPHINPIIQWFYTEVIGTFWDPQRRYIDEHYQTIPFPFAALKSPKFNQRLTWDRAHLMHYLNTWSAVKHFIREKGFNPLDELERRLKPKWPDGELKTVTFPILLRVGKVHA